MGNRLALTLLVALAVIGVTTPAESVAVHVSINPNGFSIEQFNDVAGIVMAGQTLPLEFLFDNGPVVFIGPSLSSIWSELILYTGPHHLPNGDFPYSQYVVFGSGTVAYLLGEGGNFLQTLMADFHGGLIPAPAPTLPVLGTDHGVAGGDMIAYLAQGVVGGIHFDLVLPNTGQALFGGEVGVIVNRVPEPSLVVLLIGVVAFIALTVHDRHPVTPHR